MSLGLAILGFGSATFFMWTLAGLVKEYRGPAIGSVQEYISELLRAHKKRGLIIIPMDSHSSTVLKKTAADTDTYQSDDPHGIQGGCFSSGAILTFDPSFRQQRKV